METKVIEQHTNHRKCWNEYHLEAAISILLSSGNKMSQTTRINFGNRRIPFGSVRIFYLRSEILAVDFAF